MEFAAVADIADMLAALGVIGSLLFLAFQVKQNTRTVRLQHWESHQDRLVNCFARPVDGQVAAVIDKGRANYDDLSGQEKVVFNGWASEYLLNVFSLVAFSKQGILGPDLAVMEDRRLKWFFKDKGAGQWWHDAGRHPVPPDYEGLVTDLLSKMDLAAS